jgi:hypothetical protein
LTENVTVLALGGFEDDPRIDDTYGILCKASTNGREGDLPLAETENVKGKARMPRLRSWRNMKNGWKTHGWSSRMWQKIDRRF